MDLSTIRNKLENEQYATIKDFERDVRQIFWNCYRFNDQSSPISQQAKVLEKYFNEIWAHKYGVSNRLEGADLEIARKVISKLRTHDAGFIFNEPVDINMVPDYLNIVTKPMDLRTISEKLESGQYSSLQQVDDDLRLMFNNCYAYNSPVMFAHEQGKKLEKYYNNSGRDMKNRIAAQATGVTITLPVPTKSKSNKKKRT